MNQLSLRNIKTVIFLIIALEFITPLIPSQKKNKLRENILKSKKNKFTLPFVHRIEPKDKILSTLEYGEQNIKSFEANNTKIIDINKEEYSSESQKQKSEVNSRNSSQEFQNKNRPKMDQIKNKSIHILETTTPFILKNTNSIGKI